MPENFPLVNQCLFTEKDERCWLVSVCLDSREHLSSQMPPSSMEETPYPALSLGARDQSPLRPLREALAWGWASRGSPLSQLQMDGSMVKRARTLQARSECTQPAPAFRRHYMRTQEVLLMWPLVLGATHIVILYNPHNDYNSPCLYPKFVEEGVWDLKIKESLRSLYLCVMRLELASNPPTVTKLIPTPIACPSTDRAVIRAIQGPINSISRTAFSANSS